MHLRARGFVYYECVCLSIGFAKLHPASQCVELQGGCQRALWVGCWTRAGLGGSGLDLSARGSLYFLSLCLLPSRILPHLPQFYPFVGTTRVTRGSVSHTYFPGLWVLLWEQSLRL